MLTPVQISPMRARQFGWLIAGISLIAMGIATLTPGTPARGFQPETAWWCILCSDAGLVDTALNVVLFIPFGFGLYLAGLRLRVALAGIVLVTVLIEVLQMFIIPDRDANIRDVLTNSLGGALGMLAASQWRLVILPSPRVARFLALATAGLWLATRLATTWLLAPSFLEGDWWIQVAPDGVYPADFIGAVREPRIASIPVERGPLAEPRAVRDALRAHALVSLRAEPTRTPEVLASVLGILDAKQREMFLVGQEGNDLIWRTRVRSREFGLRGPTLVLPQAFAEGSELRVEAQSLPQEWRVIAERGGAPRAISLRLDAGMFWVLVWPWEPYAQDWWPWLTLALSAGWALALGYWSGRWHEGFASAPAIAVFTMVAPMFIGAPAPWGVESAIVVLIAAMAQLVGGRRS